MGARRNESPIRWKSFSQTRRLDEVEQHIGSHKRNLKSDTENLTGFDGPEGCKDGGH